MSKKDSIPKTLCNCHISKLRCRFLIETDRGPMCQVLSIYMWSHENKYGNYRKGEDCPFKGVSLSRDGLMPSNILLAENDI
jgi:cbb3-type cytochrome oxidase cytochrome c subunit